MRWYVVPLMNHTLDNLEDCWRREKEWESKQHNPRTKGHSNVLAQFEISEYLLHAQLQYVAGLIQWMGGRTFIFKSIVHNTYTFYVILQQLFTCYFTVKFIGASMSEPHTSRESFLRTYVFFSRGDHLYPGQGEIAINRRVLRVDPR